MLKQATFALVTLGGLVLAQPRRAEAQLSDDDKKGIQAVTDRWLAAMRKGDTAGVATTYTEDATLFPPNAPVVHGRAGIAHFLGQFPKITSFDISLNEVDGHGNLAYTRGTYEVKLVPPGAKSPIKDTGKFMEVRRKEPDGSWLVLRDIWNSDHSTGR